MNKLTFIPVIFTASLALQFLLPWWIMPIVCFVVCYILRPGLFSSFAGSFIAILILWVAGAWWADRAFDQPMSSILGSIFGGLSANMVFLLTGLTGGIVAGLSGLCGAWSSRIWLAGK